MFFHWLHVLLLFPLTLYIPLRDFLRDLSLITIWWFFSLFRGFVFTLLLLLSTHYHILDHHYLTLQLRDFLNNFTITWFSRSLYHYVIFSLTLPLRDFLIHFTMTWFSHSLLTPPSTQDNDCRTSTHPLFSVFHHWSTHLCFVLNYWRNQLSFEYKNLMRTDQEMRRHKKDVC